jgi:hypothetical protein
MGQTRRLHLHIGAPKTGTTFLQSVLWQYRRSWPEYDVAYPVDSPEEMFHATLDVRALRWGGVEHPEWAGSWDRLCDRVAGVDADVVLSQELLAGADKAQVPRIVESFGDREVHIVYTLRSLVSMLRSDWQEQVKHRHTADWPEYLRQVFEEPDRSHFGQWFWGHHDAPAVLARWATALPAERIHVVVTTPAAPRRKLWTDFADLMGLPTDLELVSNRHLNVSLGRTATRLLAGVNERVADRFDDERYAAVVGQVLTNQVLPTAVNRDPLTFPAEQADFLRTRGEEIAGVLRDGPYDVVGDPQLLVDDVPITRSGATGAGVRSVALAADVVTPLLIQIGTQADEISGLRDVVNRLSSEVEQLQTAAPEPVSPLRRWIRRQSEEHESVMWARRQWWHAVERWQAWRASR